MPTPSSNPPPDPSSPRSHSFSTCPDESQLPSRSLWQSDGDTQNRPGIVIQRESISNDTSTPLVEGFPIHDESVSEYAATYGSRLSDEPLSRGTTMSPQPQFSATAVTSPAPSGPDGDFVKSDDPDTGTHNIHGSSTEDQNASTAECVQRTADHMPESAAMDRNRDLPVAETEEDELWSPSMGSDYTSKRAIPTSPSSFLRSGSRFHGTQQSERQVYDVQIEIKQVNMRESFLCGYLRIQGLTEDHPTLTTYFEGEIIGNQYNFFTEHEGWGASPKVDLSHWAKFTAFRPYQKQARKGPVKIRDIAQQENIFMRWKEHFLVPDHKVRTITGASFEGFYYICFNQIKGEVSGIYFHSKSEKFQQLELKHVPDRGCFSSMELR